MSAGISEPLLAQAGGEGEGGASIAAGAPAAVGETHAGTAAPAEHSTPSLLQFDPGVWVWSVVVFVALLVILKKMAWKPMIAAIESREKTIKDSLDQAAHIQAETLRLGEEQNRILAQARAEANAFLQSSKQAAEDLRRKMEQAAQEEKGRILASANKEIDASKNAALAELRKTTAELSIQVAEKLIRRSLDEAGQKQLVDQLIDEVSRKR